MSLKQKFLLTTQVASMFAKVASMTYDFVLFLLGQHKRSFPNWESFLNVCFKF
jgi:hypothetical protein